MLVIKVWCLPVVDEAKLNKLHKSIVRAVVSIPELELKDEKDMTCLFPSDMMEYGLGSDIVVEVTELFVNTKYPNTVRQLLAEQLGIAVNAQFPDADIVRCVIHPFSPYQGFWSSKHSDRSPSKNAARADVLEMAVSDYFVPERFQKAGLAKQMRGRIVTACSYARIKTVGDLLLYGSHEFSLRQNVAKGCGNAIRKFFKEDGIEGF